MERITEYLNEQLNGNKAIIDREAFLESVLSSIKKLVKFNYTDKKEEME